MTAWDLAALRLSLKVEALFGYRITLAGNIVGPECGDPEVRAAFRALPVEPEKDSLGYVWASWREAGAALRQAMEALR